MAGESNQNVVLLQIDASNFAEFEISEFEISRSDCILKENLFRKASVSCLSIFRCLSSRACGHFRQCWCDHIKSTYRELWLEHSGPHMFAVHSINDLAQCYSSVKRDLTNTVVRITKWNRGWYIKCFAKGKFFFSIETLNGFPNPTKCSCPKKSSKFLGLILNANGFVLNSI